MTPSMGMAAPKGMAPPAAPQAGLAALAQPNTAPRGKSPANMGQVMALARKMSDAQLADVLKGKSLDVPQYVAMTEAMGRKQLRTAVEGAQAQQGAQQASLKDKLMAEQEQAAMPQMAEAPQAGLDQLPAPGMMPQGMAGGGIVAFDEGGSVFPEPSGFDKRLWNAIKEKFSELNQPWGKTVDASPAEIRGALAGKNLAAPEKAPAIPTAQAEIADMEGSSQPPVAGLTPDSLGRYVAKNETPAPKKSGLEALVSGKQSAPTEAPQNKAMQDYLAKLEGLTAKQREGLGAIKQQGQGEALMQLASGILSSPTLAGGLAKGMPLVASTSAASRKEQAELNKTANEYDLNLAKAREAAEAGDMDRAFQYKKLADENKYRMAALNKPSDSMQLLQALGDPEMMKRFQAMNAAKKPTDVVPKGTALKEYNDMVANDYTKAFRKQYPTFESYYNELSGGTSSGGFDLSAAAKAELARRNK